MNSSTLRRGTASALAAATLAALAVVAGGTGPAAAEQDGWNAMDAYVATLVFWHRHPDWGADGVEPYSASEDYARSLEERARYHAW